MCHHNGTCLSCSALLPKDKASAQAGRQKSKVDGFRPGQRVRTASVRKFWASRSSSESGQVMVEDLHALPVKVASFHQDGLNDALDVIVTSGRAEEVAELLEDDPRTVARRVFCLNSYQRAALAEMSEEELKKLVAPAIEVLRSPTLAGKARLALSERITHESPLKIKCEISIE